MTLCVKGRLIILTNLAKNQFMDGEVSPILALYVPPSPTTVGETSWVFGG